MTKQPQDYVSPAERRDLNPRPASRLYKWAYLIIGLVLGLSIALSLCASH